MSLQFPRSCCSGDFPTVEATLSQHPSRLWLKPCFFVLCKRHWINRVPGAHRGDSSVYTLHLNSDAGYAVVPLTLLGAPVSIVTETVEQCKDRMPATLLCLRGDMLFIGTHSVTSAPRAFTAASAWWEMTIAVSSDRDPPWYCFWRTV